MLRIVVLALLLAACGGGRDRLSDADCQRWVDRFTQNVGTGIDEMRAELDPDLMKQCREGGVDKEELDCVLAATDAVGNVRCAQAALKRHPHRDAILGR